MRERGCVIIKMISSTRRMSIMGTTFGSFESSPRAVPAPPAILFLLLLGGEQATALGLGDRRHDPDARAPGRFHGLLDRRVPQLIVRLEIQDFVFRSGGEDRAKLILQRSGCNRTLIQEIPAGLVDAEYDLVLALRPGIEVLPLRKGGLEAGRNERCDDHEND